MSNETETENPVSEAAPQPPANEPSSPESHPELERMRDRALRAQADYENFRKRASREKEDAVKYANAAFLDRLIPVIDNFELGLVAARADAGGAAILAGLEMVARQLQDFLRESGIEPVEAAAGTAFDPNMHEAVSQEPSDEIVEGAVVRQLRKGFKLRDRLLRPAMVVVSKGPAA